MTRAAKARTRRHPAHALCGCFEGSALAAFARAGIEVLETEHKGCVTGGAAVACGVPLDRARRDLEDQVERWDYVFTMRAGGTSQHSSATPTVDAIAIEVHHAVAEDVPKMIAKKAWAEALLSREYPRVNVRRWVWIASPPRGEIFFLPQSPAARMLVEADISFPIASLAV